AKEGQAEPKSKRNEFVPKTHDDRVEGDVTSCAVFSKGEISRLQRQKPGDTQSVVRDESGPPQVHFAYQRVHSGYGRSPTDSILSQPCPFLRDTATLYSAFRGPPKGEDLSADRDL